MSRQSLILAGWPSVRTAPALFPIVGYVALSLSLLTSCTRNSGAEADLALKRKISGIWLSTATSSTGTATTNRTTFRPDGTFAIRETYDLPPGSYPRETAFDGLWQIRDGYLTSTLTNTSLPEVVPIGLVERYKIIRLNDSELIYKWEEKNRVFSMKRIEK